MNIKEKLNNFFSVVKLVFTKSNKKILIGIGILILSLIGVITFSVLNYNTQVKSVEIESEGWATQNPGSWHIDKSADWTGIRKARVTFDLETVAKYNEKKDIILVLDVSGSMDGIKLTKVKEDTTELVEFFLKDSQNRVAVITFSSYANVLSDFTNNKEEILNIISELEIKGTTNYTDAYKSVGKILEEYNRKEETDLVMLFLTDGYPNEETPNQVAEYIYLKEKYPYLRIDAVQYEMGNDIIKEIKEISDNQYSAYVTNLNNILFDAALSAQPYEKFVINDIIDERYFELGTIENVNVSIGKASLSIVDGKEKVTWDLGNNFKTGSKATMTIDVKLKDSVEISDSSLFPTNRGEDIEFKVPDEPEEKVESDKTPKLKGAYKVIYNSNVPSDANCNAITPDSETYFATEIATIKGTDLRNACPGYLFKGWEIKDESAIDIKRINDESFIMPSHDVYIYGTWTKLSVSKSMSGEEYNLKYALPFNGEEAYLDNTESTYVSSETGIDFKKAPSDTNGQGLYVRAGTENDKYPIFYYRGGVDSNGDGIEEVLNNNVLFANKCWKIVRTTETGGTKLVYNGLPNESNANGICANTGTSSSIRTEIAYNTDSDSLSDAGYMYGTRYPVSRKNMSAITTNIVFGNDVDYVNGQYILKDTVSEPWATFFNSPNSTGKHYTCYTSSDTCGDTVYYVHYPYSSSYSYHITLTSGEKIEDALRKMNENSNDSIIKSIIDFWFDGRIGIKDYQDYLEDTVWCNDRTLIDGGITSKDAPMGSSTFKVGMRNDWENEVISPAVKNVETCPNKNDRFTVTDTINGNGALTYPVGLLTADEATLAGNGEMGSSKSSYLTSGRTYWLMSQKSFSNWLTGYYIDAPGYLQSYGVDYTYEMDVRPSVSLKQGVVAQGGDGSISNPYRVE